jgi:hypothetical protein
MKTITLTAYIRCPKGKIFDAIVDLRGYGRWLDPSADYSGTTEISTDPVVVGTTYTERSRLGVRRGTVTELREPDLVAFHQPMVLRPRFLGVIDIHVTYSLTETTLERVVTVALPWQLKPVTPWVVARFRRESERTIQALKAFAEA